jgi:alpha-N-arabinofuranosidase
MDYCLSPKGSTTLALEREKNGHPEPFDIPFWGIGNENWGGGGNMTPEYYALEYRRFATLLEYMGFNVELIAGGANGADYAWTRGLTDMLKDKKSIVNAMSFHYYCSGNWAFGEKDPVNFTDDNWFNLLSEAERIEDILVRHYNTTTSYKMEDRLKLVIDEWGCWHAEGSGPSKGYNLFEQQSTMRDALVAATTLNIFNRHADKIRMANLAQVANNIQCLFLTEGEKFTVTPTYHVFDMYKEHQGAISLDTVVSGNEDIRHRVSVSASEKNGKLLITLANYAFEDTEVELNVLGAAIAKTASVQILRCDDIRACNTFEDPERIKPVSKNIDLAPTLTLPASSVVALSIELN